MLNKTSELKGYALEAIDGVIGHVVDFFIDDSRWAVRYVVVQTGNWLTRERVLISPTCIGEPNHQTRTLPVSITCDQVRHSPDVDTHRPVSRQHETTLADYYGAPYYWDDGGLWGPDYYANPALSGYEWDASGLLDYRHADSARSDDDPHLHSNNDFVNFVLHASDGTIGHVRDMFIEEHTWAVRYLVVKIGHWWHVDNVLIPPDWVKALDWGASEILIKHTCDAVRHIPELDAGTHFDKAAEKRYLDHFANHR